MKNPKSLLAILLIASLLVGAALSRLPKSPISVFVLKGSYNNIEFFGLRLPLGTQEPKWFFFKTTAEDKRRGGEILKSRNEKELAAFSKNFGKWSVVIGIPTSEEGWPGYLGGGPRSLFRDDSLESFDNLQFADRLYLALCVKAPPPLPFMAPEIPTGVLSNNLSPRPSATAEAVSTPTLPVHSGVLRVEILNGCGITNAAEWVAQRLKGPGIVIVDTDNADNFHYPKTIVRTAAGVPVALEEAVDRLGIPKNSIEEISNPPVSADVVVIVGKDFRKLKERARERIHH